MGDSEEVYGYRFAGTGFRQVIRISDEGVCFKSGDLVPWAKVVGLRASPDFLLDKAFDSLGVPQPRVSIYLDDGRVFSFRGTGLRRPESRRIRWFESVSEEYQSAVQRLKARVRRGWEGPREERIVLHTGYAIALAAFVVTVCILGWSGIAVSRDTQLGIGMTAAVLLGQLGFVVGPVVARWMRKRYLHQAGGLLNSE